MIPWQLAVQAGWHVREKKAISSVCQQFISLSLIRINMAAMVGVWFIHLSSALSTNPFFEGKWWTIPVTDSFHSNIRIIWGFKEEGKEECLVFACQTNKTEGGKCIGNICSTMVAMNSAPAFERREGILIDAVTCKGQVHKSLFLLSSVGSRMMAWKEHSL